MKHPHVLLALIKANLMMFIRDKSALFWSLFFPFIIIGIFGVLDFANMGTMNVGIVSTEQTEVYAQAVQKVFEKNSNYKFHTGSRASEISELENENRAIVIEFETDPISNNTIVTTYTSQENQQSGEVMTLVTEKILADVSLQMQNIDLPFEIKREIVNTNNLRYIDFVIPGVVALALMQGALFGVVGAIVQNREKGVLRRIFATPLPRSQFLISNIIARLVISLAQIAVLLTFSYLVFKINIVGSIFMVVGAATLGSLVFLTLGILISGFSKTAESAQAMMMPVQMVFMFTSGVYFDRSVLPKWLFDISAYFPLTYLSDMLRDIMVKGYDLSATSVRLSAVALTVWLVALVVIAVRTFRWEIE